MKQFTLENLNKDDACTEGIAYVRPLIEARQNVAAHLFRDRRGWFSWAFGRGYDVSSVTGLMPKYAVETLQKYDEARQEYDEARLKYDEARQEYDEARLKYDEARQKYDEAWQKYDEARQKYDEAWQKCWASVVTRLEEAGELCTTYWTCPTC